MGLRKETVKLSLITSISIVGGLLFHILLGRRYGVSWQLDCFFIVLTLLGCLGIINAFITSLYIPIFNEVKKKSEQESIIFADVVIKWVTMISVLIVALIFVFDDVIIRLLAPGFDLRSIALSKELIRIVIFGLVFYSISHAVAVTLQALYFYAVPALTGIVDPILNIAGLIFLVPRIGIKGIAYATLISNVIKASIFVGYLALKTNWRPSLRLYHERMPELINKSSKMATNGMIWSLRDILIRNIASRMGEGAITLFSYADKIINILIQTIINPLVKVYYSRVSEWIVFSKWDDIRALLRRTARVNMLLSLFVSSGCVVFLPSVLYLFFYKSKFTITDINILSTFLNFMLVYFMILSFENYFSRIVYASKRVKVVALAATSGIIILFASANTLSKRLGIYSLPISITLAQTLVCSIYY
ncbi:MAG: polysaccharide biosynthesis C-terminal domain-containing protein, partial [Candidatus Pacebacteria bacterium]|nr:polysaccharide biosynthesis C-terminal domain-containing protein [Candidatus Paceibacterota bacterium]